MEGLDKDLKTIEVQMKDVIDKDDDKKIQKFGIFITKLENEIFQKHLEYYKNNFNTLKSFLF